MKEGGKSKKPLSSFPIRPSILFVYDKIFIFSKYRIRLDERLKKVIITTIEKQRERQEVQQLATKKKEKKKKGIWSRSHPRQDITADRNAQTNIVTEIFPRQLKFFFF
jgi:hypothetical protein